MFFIITFLFTILDWFLICNYIIGVVTFKLLFFLIVSTFQYIIILVFCMTGIFICNTLSRWLNQLPFFVLDFIRLVFCYSKQSKSGNVGS